MLIGVGLSACTEYLKLQRPAPFRYIHEYSNDQGDGTLTAQHMRWYTYECDEHAAHWLTLCATQPVQTGPIGIGHKGGPVLWVWVLSM